MGIKRLTVLLAFVLLTILGNYAINAAAGDLALVEDALLKIGDSDTVITIAPIEPRPGCELMLWDGSTQIPPIAWSAPQAEQSGKLTRGNLTAAKLYGKTISLYEIVSGMSTPGTMEPISTLTVPTVSAGLIAPTIDYANEQYEGIGIWVEQGEIFASQSKFMTSDNSYQLTSLALISQIDTDGNATLLKPTDPWAAVSLWFQRREPGKFCISPLPLTIDVSRNAAKPTVNDITIDYQQEIMYQAGGISIEWSHTQDGTYTALSESGIALNNGMLQDATFYIRRAGVSTSTQSTLPSLPIALKIPSPAAPLTAEQVKTQLIDWENEALYRIDPTDTYSYQYRLTPKSAWVDIPITKAAALGSAVPLDRSQRAPKSDLVRLGLDKGIKKIEFRVKGGAAAIVDETNLGHFSSESISVPLSRPRAPLKTDYYLDFTHVVGADIVGKIMPREGIMYNLQIAFYDKKNKTLSNRYNLAGNNQLNVTYIYSDPNTELYDNATGTLKAVLGKDYALVKAANSTPGEQEFASKPITFKLAAAKKALKYEYIPVTDKFKGLKDGKILYFLGDPTTSNDAWKVFDRKNEQTREQSEAIITPNEPNGAVKEVFFRSIGTKKTPAGTISQKVIIPPRAASLEPIFGTGEPVGNQLIIDSTNELIKTSKAGQAAYRRYKAGATKQMTWRVMKKQDTPLKTFIPKSGEVVYEFVQVGNITLGADSYSNSEPISITFVQRPENPKEDDITYDDVNEVYTAGDRDLLVSADKKQWERLSAGESLDATQFDRPIFYKIAPQPDPKTGTTAPTPASAKFFDSKRLQYD